MPEYHTLEKLSLQETMKRQDNQNAIVSSPESCFVAKFILFVYFAFPRLATDSIAFLTVSSSPRNCIDTTGYNNANVRINGR